MSDQLTDLRTEEGNLKQAIADAAGRVITKLDSLETKLAAQPLTAPAAEDLSSDIQALRDDVAALGQIAADAAPSTPVASIGTTTGTTTPPPVTLPAGAVPVAVGDTVGVPVDPADPDSPTMDHTVTAIGTDGTITAEPVAAIPLTIQAQGDGVHDDKQGDEHAAA